MSCFHLLLSEQFYDNLLTETNQYAHQQRTLKNDTSPWNPVSREELMAFIGINIAMGIISLPCVDDYWSTDPILCHSWFRIVMPRNRFRQILRYIHVVDNTNAPKCTDPDYDKLWKVRSLLNALEESTSQLYSPHQQVSINESMIGTKCRLLFIQYMPQKPTKWGIKVWVCSDARNGYIYNFDVYAGANPSTPKYPNGQAYDVVMKLTEPLHGKGYTVYTDNFYTSAALFKDLLTKKLMASGTL